MSRMNKKNVYWSKKKNDGKISENECCTIVTLDNDNSIYNFTYTIVDNHRYILRGNFSG